MRTLLIAALTFGICFMATAQTPGARTFKATLADGSDTKLVVSEDSGVIEFRNAQAVTFSFPVDAITEIIHVTQPVRRSTKAYNRLEEMCCGGTESHALSLLAMAIAAPLGHAQNHYVEIHWSHNGDGTVLLELGKDNYVPFVNWLQQKSGTKWRDIEKEREQALRSIYQRAPSAIPVLIQYPHENVVSMYKFWVLALDDNEATELFLFDSEVKPKNLVSILPVMRKWSMNTCVDDVAVLYGECREKGCDIDAILFPTLTYRVVKSHPRPVATNAKGEAESDCAQLNRRRMEWQKWLTQKALGNDDRPTVKRRQ